VARRFGAAAKSAEADESGKSFEEAFKTIIRPKENAGNKQATSRQFFPSCFAGPIAVPISRQYSERVEVHDSITSYSAH